MNTHQLLEFVQDTLGTLRFALMLPPVHRSLTRLVQIISPMFAPANSSGREIRFGPQGCRDLDNDDGRLFRKPAFSGRVGVADFPIGVGVTGNGQNQERLGPGQMVTVSAPQQVLQAGEESHSFRTVDHSPLGYWGSANQGEQQE